jgi:hypothetical protein
MKTLLFFCGLLMNAVLWAADVSIDDIIHRANLASFYAGEDGRAEARMLIEDAKGNKQMRQFVILRKDLVDAGEQQFLVVFSRPSDVKDTVFLVHKKVAEEDDRWLYLPALDLEKRIAASDNRTSFVGSDFFYEDVSGRNPAADNHRLVNQDDGFFYVESEPKEPALVEFVRYTMKIDRQTYLPMLIEYHDASGDVYRRVEVLGIDTVQGHPTVMQSKVSNLQTGGHTLLQFRGPSYDLGMDEAVFTTRSLRNPPRTWLKAQ